MTAAQSRAQMQPHGDAITWRCNTVEQGVTCAGASSANRCIRQELSATYAHICVASSFSMAEHRSNQLQTGLAGPAVYLTVSFFEPQVPPYCHSARHPTVE
jgi:hypothetical protein